MKMRRDQATTRRAIKAEIAAGHIIVIYEDYVLRLDSWLDKHPGGRLAILHMIGRDATDEIKAYHSQATLQTMKAYRVARKPAGLWHNLTPPIRRDDGTLSEGDRPAHISMLDDASESSSSSGDSSTSSVSSTLAADLLQRRRHESPSSAMTNAEFADAAMRLEVEDDMRKYPAADAATQAAIADKYRELERRIRDAKLYDCPYGEYAKEAARYALLLAASLLCLHRGYHTASAVLLGLFWHQIMFTAHDAGHTSITHVFAIDTTIAVLIADLCCGLSMSWWKASHNVHHLVTNAPAHDPDIQNVPLFATCPSFFKSLRSTSYDGFTYAWDAAADLMVRHQAWTYYPVMAVARFNLYLLSALHLLSPRGAALARTKAWWIRPLEMLCLAAYWYLFGYRLLYLGLPDVYSRALYVLVSHVATAPLHVQITLSHWGMPTSSLGEAESFAQRQLRTTMDVACPAWLDWLHGGLQFQAVHHLFPRVPRHNLRKAQALVREFCDETGIPYTILGFADGNRKVLGRLGEVAAQLRVMLECQAHMARTGESGLH